MRKIYLRLVESLNKVLGDDLGKLLIISLFSYLGYGINRYFYGKYFASPFIIKSGKFFIGYLNHFFLWLGIFIFISFLFKYKKVIIYIILGIFGVLGVTETLLLSNFKTIINNSTIQILFETNFNETSEFLKEYFNYKIILLLLGIIIVFYIVNRIKINIKNNKLKNLILIYSLFQLFNFGKEIKDSSIYRFINAINHSINNIKIYKEMSQNLKNDVIIKKNKSKIKNIVLIIGESTGKNHMSLYGYKYKTNPLLEKLEREKEIYKYTDVISPHSHTIPVLQKLLTFYNNEAEKEWYKYNNIVDIMKKSGYKTYWFSNQEAFGIFGNVAAAIGNRSDVVVFNKLRDSSEEAFEVYDKEIVDKSVKFLSDDSNKNFIVYHLLGTHTSYKYRYPKEFKIFDKNDYQEKQSKEREIISEYDNAVLYNDYVVNEIINLYKDKESIIFYLSDHGEEVYEFRDFIGHGEDTPSRYMTEIPFIIYLSEKFKIKYPEIKESIENSLKQPYMIDDFIHTLLDISEIETEEFDEEKSIINEKFDNTRERIFGNKSYDDYWRNKD